MVITVGIFRGRGSLRDQFGRRKAAGFSHVLWPPVFNLRGRTDKAPANPAGALPSGIQLDLNAGMNLKHVPDPAPIPAKLIRRAVSFEELDQLLSRLRVVDCSQNREASEELPTPSHPLD